MRLETQTPNLMSATLLYFCEFAKGVFVKLLQSEKPCSRD